MATTITLQPAHGYLPLLVAGTVVVNMWASIKVGGARKNYGVEYPQVSSLSDTELLILLIVSMSLCAQSS